MKIFRIYTLDKRGSVHPGAAVEEITLRSGAVIPAITVGEEGRGRERGLLPVQGAPGAAPIYAAALSSTRAGRPKLIVSAQASQDSAIIVVCRVEPGFRGGIEYTGPRLGVQCGDALWSWATPECLEIRSHRPEDGRCPGCGKRFFRERTAPAPGQILISGRVAQGDAGRMGGGEQRILLLPAGQTLRIERTGRLYGEPGEIWYTYTPERGLIASSPEEADLLD